VENFWIFWLWLFEVPSGTIFVRQLGLLGFRGPLKLMEMNRNYETCFPGFGFLAIFWSQIQKMTLFLLF